MNHDKLESEGTGVLCDSSPQTAFAPVDALCRGEEQEAGTPSLISLPLPSGQVRGQEVGDLRETWGCAARKMPPSGTVRAGRPVTLPPGSLSAPSPIPHSTFPPHWTTGSFSFSSGLSSPLPLLGWKGIARKRWAGWWRRGKDPHVVGVGAFHCPPLPTRGPRAL